MSFPLCSSFLIALATLSSASWSYPDDVTVDYTTSDIVPLDRSAIKDAPVVISGEVIKIDYLFRNSLPFLTRYTVAVNEVISGNAADTIEVLSTFGPLRRDLRKWKRPPEWNVSIGKSGAFLLRDASEFLHGRSAARHAGAYTFYRPEIESIIDSVDAVKTIFQK